VPVLYLGPSCSHSLLSHLHHSCTDTLTSRGVGWVMERRDTRMDDGCQPDEGPRKTSRKPILHNNGDYKSLVTPPVFWKGDPSFKCLPGYQILGQRFLRAFLESANSNFWTVNYFILSNNHVIPDTVLALYTHHTILRY